MTAMQERQQDMNIAAILLGAGASQRFGPSNKLVARIGGVPIVARVAGALGLSRVCAIIVVTPPEGHAGRREVAEALEPLQLRSLNPSLSVVANPDPARGMGSSIAAGIRALGPSHDGALIVPGDMPALTAAVIDRLVQRFIDAGGEAIVYAATSDGRQRNPVIWPRRLFPALAALDGDAGGKPLIAAERASSPARVIAVPFDDEQAFCDIDTVADIADWM